MSFGIFDSYVHSRCCSVPLANLHILTSTHLLTDPTAFEEPLLDTTFTITLDTNGGLISVTQLGVGSIGAEDVLGHCISAAKARCEEIGKRIYS